MTPRATLIASRKGSSGLLFTTIYLAAMVVLYIGERLLFDSTTARLVLDALAVLGLVVALVGRGLRRKKVPTNAKPVEAKILLFYAIGAVSLILYAAQADLVMDHIRPWFSQPQSADRYQGVLMVLWPILWACAIVPLVFIEISYAPMDIYTTMEPTRIARSTRSGLILAMSLCLLGLLNYIFSEFNKKVDLSYFKTTRASESSKKMIHNLSKPMQAMLFFPGANEVQDQVEAYFEDLKKQSNKLKVQVVDHAMEPALAKEYNVSNNGIIVLVRDKQNQQINIGTQLTRAKGKLKTLDDEFQKAFTKLVRDQKVAYFTVGHEERSSELRDKVSDSSIRDLRSLLERMNYLIKDLGLSQGLGAEVPKDASVVIVAGPQKEFLPEEIKSLIQYLKGGGRMMIFLDPEAKIDLSGLLNPLGLKYVPVPLANDRFMVRMSHTQGDRQILVSNRFSAHPSVSTLTQNSNRIATLMIGAGYLEETPPEKGLKTQVQFTVHSMPFTWNDENKNQTFDAPNEKRRIYELCAIVTLPTSASAKAKGVDKGANNKGGDEMRLLVVADSDLISDRIFRNPGNGYLFLDGLKWLGDEEEYIGETTSEEDVRIMHTRKEDQLWFYLTIFGVPALVLVSGFYYTRRRRKK